MATKMELVLSPGNLGGDSTDGGPFRNEDVREWSRVDQITGMLERARVETGRWRANTRDAAQSYGKMVDSRERNSADGSLVQKARRQVEIFQSQGTGGRSFQVVRASQWSSSRATDVPIFDVPMNKSNSNSHLFNGAMNGDSSLSPRLSLWRASLEDKASDLEQLSCLCRKLHDEALSQSSNFWSLKADDASRSPTPPISLKEANGDLETGNDALSSNGSLADRRSNSSEDLTSQPARQAAEDDESFARDCKVRRSLQINGQASNESRSRRNNELVAERARKFEEGARRASEAGSGKKVTPRNFISTKSFASIADNDFVKNDPKHPSKLAGQQVAKITFQDSAAVAALAASGGGGGGGGQNGQTLRVASPVPSRANVKAEPVVVLPAMGTRKANNKTVVHLRNVASPDDSGEPTRCINVTAIKVEKDKEQPRNETSEYSMLLDATSNGHAVKEESVPQPQTVANGAKPVKRVEFCKTEIHFAPDSGKVNIVETESKPPPTNKFRRRRRNNSLNSTLNNAQKSNLPLVHFGDTSYEKFIFGGQGKPPATAAAPDVKKTDNSPLVDEIGKSYNGHEQEPARAHQRWNAAEKVSREESSALAAAKDSYADCTSLERAADHSNKQRGAHTTTVNFLSSENSSVVPKVGEDKASIRYPPANHIAHKEIGQLDKRPSKAQVITKDSDNNQVLLKIITTHKPTVARVENEHPMKPVRSRSVKSSDDARLRSIDEVDKNVPEKYERSSDAKAPCDTASNGTSEAGHEEPTYENVFDAVSDGSGPVYQNFQAVRNAEARGDKKTGGAEKVAVKKKPSAEKAPNGNSHERRHRPRLSSRASNDSDGTAERPSKAKVKPSSRSATPMSTLSSGAKSDKSSDNPESKRTATQRSSARSNGSRENSIRKYKEAKQVKEDGSLKGTQPRRKSSSKDGPQLVGGKNAAIVKSIDKNGGSVRSKKAPVEVVYQTAVYNIKNENLNKPKLKEVKGPRLINDLICGSKTKRPSDKKMIKTAVASQNTSKRKETPTLIKR